MWLENRFFPPVYGFLIAGPQAAGGEVRYFAIIASRAIIQK
jgi:hypothetical protein